MQLYIEFGEGLSMKILFFLLYSEHYSNYASAVHVS